MADDDVQVKVEDEPVYEAEAEPVEGEEGGNIKDAIKDGKNPLDAMDGYTLLVGVLIASIIVFVAAILDLWVTAGAFALLNAGLAYWIFAGSLISIIVAVVMIILKKCAEDASIKAGPIISIILLVIWLAIALPGTFGQFTDLENGWIGCWAGLALSGALAGRAFADKVAAMEAAIKSQTESSATKFALFCGVASLVVLIAASLLGSTFIPTAGASCGAGSQGYAIALAVISMIVAIIILVFANVETLKQHSGMTNMILSIFLVVWWAIGAFYTTFVGPFGGAGCGLNGFIAVWISLFSAISLFKACGLDAVKQWIEKVKGNKGGESNETSNNDDTPAL